MRELGFSQRGPKLKQPEFTTFRCPRRDRDWHKGEMVRVVHRPRSEDREVLGVAQIVNKELRIMGRITEEEARADGFVDLAAMLEWMESAHGQERIAPGQKIHKLTLAWGRPMI